MNHSAEPNRDPYAALRFPAYRRYLTGNFLSNVGRQALTIAATWQIYQWTNSATALGLVGLVNVVPLLCLVLPAGALADRFDRRAILIRCMAGSATISIALALLSYFHASVPNLEILQGANRMLRAIALFFERHADPATLEFEHPALPVIYLLLFLHAVIRVIGAPSRGSLVPRLVPVESLNNAVTWSSSSFELSTVVGPALGGLVVAASSFAFVYAMDVLCSLALAVALVGVKLHPVRKEEAALPAEPPGALAGLRFIWKRQAILAALTLDLFAVLLGGATALLPIYADQILHVGAAGLGWLRAAPALGAISMAFIVAHLPAVRRPGLMTLWSVAGFGACIAVFALSKNLWLSLLALFLSGACDNVSVVVRHTVVQMLTPDALRGRVTSVNQLFIGSSNEISALRAGLMAALIGPVLAASLGGLGTILVTAVVALMWPGLRALPALHTLKPDNDADAAKKPAA